MRHLVYNYIIRVVGELLSSQSAFRVVAKVPLGNTLNNKRDVSLSRAWSPTMSMISGFLPELQFPFYLEVVIYMLESNYKEK